MHTHTHTHTHTIHNIQSAAKCSQFMGVVAGVYILHSAYI